jgi:CP family cyanate transporter-like MFS transporter
VTIPAAVRPLWAGRTIALVGILLVALNVRTAVASLSPIVHRISEDVPLDSLGLGLLGTLPPIAFAISGVIAPFVARRLGLDAALVIACLAMVLGPVLRGIAPSYAVLVIGSAVALFGMGFGNVLLPPAVKRYFPDRIGVVTAGYVTLLAVSTAMAAAVAEPVAAVAGWRVSTAIWAVLAVAAALPWILLAMRSRRERAGATEALPPVVRLRGLHRSGVAWSITIAFVVSAITVYAAFAWLPVLLVEHAGVTEVEAGALLALFSIIGLPMGLFVPVLATRMRNVGLLVLVGALCSFVGFAGIWLLPAAVVVWVIVAGAGGILFPVCLVLINTRTRTEQGSIALSGFVQTFGYTGGALGPLGVAFLHDVVGGWTAPLIALAAVSLVAIIPGITLAKPHFVEDDLAPRPVE